MPQGRPIIAGLHLIQRHRQDLAAPVADHDSCQLAGPLGTEPFCDPRQLKTMSLRNAKIDLANAGSGIAGAGRCGSLGSCGHRGAS